MNANFLNIDWAFFDKEFLDEKVYNYIWFAGILLGSILLKKPLARLVARLSSGMTSKLSYIQHRTTIQDVLFRPIEHLLQIVLFYVAIHKLDGLMDHFDLKHFFGKKFHYGIADIIDYLLLFLFIILFTQVASRFIDFIYYLRMSNAQNEKNLSRIQLLPLVKEMSKLILWVLSTFWLLGSVFHVNIPALITGLGIGGVAIALAGKATVENIFAALTILSDKPFQTGEYIKLGEIEGTVERIGFRSTRLRNLDGSAHIIPNQNLVSNNLINLSARETRGMKVYVNIKYGITHDQLQTLITTLKTELIKTPPITEPITIVIETFDKETFLLMVNYFIPHPLPADMKLLAVKSQINLKIFELVSNVAQIGTPVGTS